MAQHNINDRNFRYPATTKNTTGNLDFSAAARRSIPKPKKNYFSKQKMKLGDDWIAKKTSQDLENGVKDVLRDLVKGLITNDDFYYFYNEKFSQAIRTATYEKMNYYRILARAADTLRVAVSHNMEILPQADIEILDQQVILFRAYTDLQNALVEFSRLSPDANAAINYMADFQREMNKRYGYAVKCF